MSSESNDTAVTPLLASENWQRLSPWALLYFLLNSLRGVMQSGIYIVIPAVITVYNRIGLLGLLWLAAILLTVSGTIGLLRYRRFQFRFSDDRLEVRQGILQHEGTDLRYARVQNVALELPWYYRPMKLGILSVDSAGSAAAEIHLPAITRQQADDIRAHIYQEQHQHHSTATDNGEDDSADMSAPHAIQPEPAQVLHQSSSRDLLVYGVSNRALFWFFAIAGPFLGSEAIDRILLPLQQRLSDTLPAWFDSAPAIVGAISLLMLVMFGVLLLGSLLLTWIRLHGFTLTLSQQRFIAAYGLFNRREQSVQRRKIQFLILDNPLFSQWCRRTTLQCQQINDAVPSGPGEGQGKGTLQVPAVPDEDIPALLRQFAPEAPPIPAPEAFQGVHPRVWRGPVIGSAIAVLTLTLMALIPVDGQTLPAHFPLIGVVVLAVVLLLSRRRWRWWGVYLAGDTLFVRQGVLGSKMTILALHRVQSMQCRQSPLHRLFRVADLHVRLAGGHLRIPSLAIEHAQAIIDQALVKTSKRDVAS